MYIFRYNNGVKNIIFDEDSKKEYSFKDIDHIKINKDKLIIHWDMTYLCNLDCDFCIQGDKASHIRKSKGETSTIRKDIANAIKNIIETQNREVSINIMGGEATILSDFIDCISIICSNKSKYKTSINLTTNLTIKIEQVLKLYDISISNTNIRFGFNLSYYPEYTTLERFIDRANYIKNTIQNSSITCTYLISNNNDVMNFLKFKETLQNHGLKTRPVIMRLNDGNNFFKPAVLSDTSRKLLMLSTDNKSKNFIVTYSDGEEARYSSIQDIVSSIKENYLSFKGYQCDSGINSISVNNLGMVTSCKNCSQDLGCIYSKDFKLLNKKIVCNALQCNCKVFTEVKKGN